MRRASKALLSLAMTAVIGAMVPAAALGQPGVPASSAKAAPPGGAKPGDKRGDVKPTGDKAAEPKGAASALPSGHPPTEAVPSGHPAVPDEAAPDDEGDEEPNPHGGGSQHGADPRFYQPPPDGTMEDPALPVGTVVVNLRDAMDQPIPNARFTWSEQFSNVAKGDSPEHTSNRQVGPDGTLRIDGLTIGTGTTYSLTTSRAGARYTLQRFALDDKGGKRAVLHVYEASSNLEELQTGTQGVVYLSLKEDVIQIEQLLSVFNLGAVSWVPNVAFKLPDGFKAFNKQETPSEAQIEEVKDHGAALRGTYGPGRHDIDFRYQVPLDGTETQTIRIELPPHVAQARVIAESSRSMALKVVGFPDSQKVARDGKRLLVTERGFSRAESAAQTIEITLTGLPVPSPGRWVAALLALIALVAGIVHVARSRAEAEIDDDTRADLTEAREALLSEVVLLERAHQSGEIGPKTYARLRASLLDALAQIVGRLETARDARAGAKKRARTRQTAGETS